MTELILYLPECVGAEGVRWRIVDGPSTLRAGEGVPPADARGERSRAVLDARAVHLRSVTVPARQRGQMVRALPFAVEEFLADDIENQHLALGRDVRPGHPAWVAAVERKLLQAWLEWLAENDIELSSLVPETALVPLPQAGGLQLLGLRNGWLFAGEAAAGWFPDDWWPVVIDGLLAGRATVNAQLCADAGVDLDTLRQTQIESSGEDDPVTVTVERLTERADDWMARQLVADASRIELLQGRYAPADNTPALPGALRLLGSLAAGWLVLFVLFQAGSAWLLDSSAQRLRDDTHALYRELFPDEQRIVNPVAQMRAHLANSGVAADGSTFMELFERTATGVAGSEVQLRNVSYNSSRDDASIEILAREFAILEQLQERLDKGGLEVEITSAEQEEGIIRARLRVKVGST